MTTNLNLPWLTGGRGGDLLDLHQRAVAGCAAVVTAAAAGQLDWPTPCSEWSLGDLLAHMIGHNVGFAAAALGSSDAGAFADVRLAPGLAVQFAASAQATVAAFTGLDLGRDGVYLAVVRGGTRADARTAVCFHLVDTVVHGWDVATAAGLPVGYDDDVEQAALAIARAVPDDQSRVQPGAAFRPGQADPGTTPLQRIVAALGRDPHWAK